MAYTVKDISDNWTDPNFKFFINRGSPKECMKFLIQNKNMKDEYLGACLNYIKWGGKTTMMYELGTKEMINFIQRWMDLNKDNLIWNEKTPSKNFELPYIKHNKCPVNKEHTETTSDLVGRVRCAHKSEKRLKPSFVRSFSYFDKDRQAKVVDYLEDEPRSNLPEEAWDENTGKLLEDYKDDWEKYQEQINKFKEEKPTFVVNDICYSILSDEKMVLSLEEVLDRLNLQPRMKTVYCSGIKCKRLDELSKEKREFCECGMCPGHKEENDETVHSFDGWKLARYVQKWYEQLPNGKAPIFEKK